MKMFVNAMNENEWFLVKVLFSEYLTIKQRWQPNGANEAVSENSTIETYVYLQ